MKEMNIFYSENVKTLNKLERMTETRMTSHAQEQAESICKNDYYQ